MEGLLISSPENIKGINHFSNYKIQEVENGWHGIFKHDIDDTSTLIDILDALVESDQSVIPCENIGDVYVQNNKLAIIYLNEDDEITDEIVQIEDAVILRNFNGEVQFNDYITGNGDYNFFILWTFA